MSTTNTVSPLILPTDAISELSLEAIGLLSTMVNIPECDYITDKQLCEYSPSDSLLSIRQALAELVEKDYLNLFDDGIYAVNKLKIINMKIARREIKNGKN